MTGIELIAKERDEQVTKHHINTGMDVIHNADTQLRVAARRLLAFEPKEMGEPLRWDKPTWDRMTSKPYKERLIIAGALIAAELDRLKALAEKEA